MDKLLEILAWDYILRNSLYASLLIGAVVPLVGTLLVAARRSMLALALPQVGKFGVTLTVCAASLAGVDFSARDHEGRFFALALLGALAAMALAIFVLWCLEWGRSGETESHTGALYACAGAGTVILAASHLVPELGLLNVLKGEVLTVPSGNLLGLLAGYTAIAVVLLLLRHPIQMVVYDQWLAYTSGLPARAISALLLALVCLTIALGGLCSDPLAIFAFLILPPLTVLPFARRITHVYIGAVLVGVIGAFAGFYVSCAYEDLNLPTSAAQIASLGIFWIVSFVFVLAAEKFRGARPNKPQVEPSTAQGAAS